MDRIDAHVRSLEDTFATELNEKMARWRAAYDRDVARIGEPVAQEKAKRKLRDELMQHFLMLGLLFASLYGIRLLAFHRRKLRQNAVSLATATATMIGGHTQQLADAGNIDAAFSPSRAHAIAVTETTRGFSAMGEFIVKALRLDHRFDTWWTSEDEKVCATCGSLHNAPRRVWSKAYPDGTPAHPVCRCRIRYWNLRGRS